MSNISRRDLFKGLAAAGLGTMLPGGAQAAGSGRGEGDDHGEITFVNGRIHTMDDKGTVVSSVAIKNGRFVSVGRAANPGPGSKVIDLKGRTVVPGLLESHTHFVSLANRPGYHVVLELARNISEVQELLAARRARGDVPQGQFITAMGGWSPNQWWRNPADVRLPTLAELDAAVPDRPVFLYQGGFGPARTNTLGKAFFESVSSPLAGPVLVGAEGEIINTGGVNHPNRALYHLRVRQSFEDKKRSAFDAMAYSASVGVTAMLDQTLVAVNSGTHNPATLDPQPTHGLPTLNHFRMYDGWLAVHRDGDALIRLQINFLHNQGFVPEHGPNLADQLPELRARLKNQFQFFGDGMVRTGGIGEWAAPFGALNTPNGAVWFEAQRLVAKAGWRNENAQSSVANIQQVVETYEKMDEEFGIKHLRWGLQHGDLATDEQLARLKALNCGISTSGFRWTNASTVDRTPENPVGPFFPRLFNSGVPMALHEDGVHIAPHNPWFAMHYATTGLNVFGRQINPGQHITRQQALHGYTRAAAWYLNREDDLGSIEVGKMADMIVLDRDYFSVSDAAMRETRVVLSVVDGKIVHDTGVA